MKNVTETILMNAIGNSWRSAHTSDDIDQWIYAWMHTASELDGMWTLMLYADGDKSLMDDIRLLRWIAKTLALRCMPTFREKAA